MKLRTPEEIDADIARLNPSHKDLAAIDAIRSELEALRKAAAEVVDVFRDTPLLELRQHGALLVLERELKMHEQH